MSETEKSCYKTWIQSKTGFCLPCYADGKPCASVYDPEKEAHTFADLEVFAKAGFIFIAGIGSTLHLKALAERYPNTRIAVVEANQESVRFVLENPTIHLAGNISICTADQTYDFLLQHYFPPENGNFCLFPLRSWAQANQPVFENIKESVNKALRDISADVSTQARFGKIWHKNIVNNLFLYSEAPEDKIVDFEKAVFPTEKTAFVAAAGPGLESCFDILKKRRSSYYLIATDTAFSALKAQGIHSDAVVTMDPQQFSINHFHMHIEATVLFVCDLCCCPAIVRKALHCGSSVLFFKSAHPLCSLVELYRISCSANKKRPLFPFFDCSSGTVTLTALDFAVKAGFTSIKTGGADFCYAGGKAYTRGSYFDTLFGARSCRLLPAEQRFCRLMYKSPLELLRSFPEKVFTTALLKQYERTFRRFCALHPFVDKEAEPRSTAMDCKKSKERLNSKRCFEFERRFSAAVFLHWYAKKLRLLTAASPLTGGFPENKTYTNENLVEKAVKNSILPYMAWYNRNHDECFSTKKIAAEICNNQKKYLYNTDLT